MADIKSSRSQRSRRPAGRGTKRKMNAAALVSMLRRHGALTLTVSLLIVSMVTGYMAIELGA